MLKIFLYIAMILTDSQMLSLIKNPKNTGAIEQAKYEERLLSAFATGEGVNNHAYGSDLQYYYNDDGSYSQPYYRDVLLWEYLSLLVPERHETFAKTFGNHAMPITNKVETHFNRVFEATGRFTNFKFGNPEERADFEEYIQTAYESKGDKQNGIGLSEFLQKEAVASILFSPNTVAIIDFPAQITEEVKTGNSIPTVQKAYVNKFHDIDVSSRDIEYIIIRNEVRSPEDKRKIIKTQFFIIDDEKFVLYERQKGSSELNQVIKEFHNLPKIPVKFFTRYTRYKKQYFPRKSPIWDSIDDLKRWLLLANFMKVYQYESGVPIKFSIQQPCRHKERYVDPRTKQMSFTDECTSHNGTGVFSIATAYQNGKYTYAHVNCPSCRKRSQEKTAWGKELEIPQAWFEEDKAKWVFETYKNADFSTDIIKVNSEDLDKGRVQIEVDIIGKAYNAEKSKEAKNTDQVSADLLDMQRVLVTVSEDVETMAKFTLDFIAIGRGYESFISNEFHLGRGYLLQSNDKHIKEFKELRDNGADPFFLNQKQFEIFEGQYGYDRATVELFQIFASLVPFRNMTVTEVYGNFEIYKSNPQTLKDFYKRIYADQILQEFVTKNNVQIWGREVSFNARVNRLNRALEARAEELAGGFQVIEEVAEVEEEGDE